MMLTKEEARLWGEILIGFSQGKEYVYPHTYDIDICDAVYFLDDWTASQGAIQELKYAAKKGKAILWENKNEKEVAAF